MIGNKRNFSLSLWDHEDNFLCLLKSSNEEINGQSYDEQLIENIYGEQTLTFSIPAYIFDIKPKEENEEEEKKEPEYGFIKNKKWDYIFNEQKIRYIEYDELTNQPKENGIKEFVLKNYTENRNNEEKIIQCQCESLAVYELGKIGWNINFDVDYVTPYENRQNDPELITLDYWLKKIFYKETHLGRVSTTTECTYLLQGIQLRNEEGYPISDNYEENNKGEYNHIIVEEPICETSIPEKYLNPTGWTWEVQALYKNDPSFSSFTTNIYEEPTINMYVESSPNCYTAKSYQKRINESDSEKRLLSYPIKEQNYGSLVYVTDIKKRLIKAERSNIFSIIQDLCEAFEVWAYFNYSYDNNGKIKERKITFKTESINTDIKFDFSYGKNLLSCNRTIDSNELITKLSVPDITSTLEDGKILSIKQATANPTYEGYIYNFEYFYNLGSLTKGEQDPNSDEYKINTHNGQIRKYNEIITRLQNNLTPLYDRKTTLESDLVVKQASYTALVDNIRSLQDKISIIPENEQIIRSWSLDNSQYNHIGELKTISLTTIEGQNYGYINFGREDILYGDEPFIIRSCIFTEKNELIEGEEIEITSYMPRYYSASTWVKGFELEEEKTDEFFKKLSEIGEPDYADDSTTTYIKGFKVFEDRIPEDSTYIRIRYKYAPLSYDYYLLRKYYNNLIGLNEEIQNLEKDIKFIKNKILILELNLNCVLLEKNELILEFEKKYKNYIKDGYWDANNYKSHIISKTLYTDDFNNFEGLKRNNVDLNTLKLNDSLNTYKYYINTNISSSTIDINSISMTTKNPSNSGNVFLTRYRGNDYEVFINENEKIIIGISPNLIDNYDFYDWENKNKKDYYKSTISYRLNGESQNSTTTISWTEIGMISPKVQEKFIYLTNDNLIVEDLEIFGCKRNSNNEIIQQEKLEINTDYTYNFDYIGYDSEGKIVDLKNNETYQNAIHYDYIVKIILKPTNRVLSYGDSFKVNYNEENTLQFFYNDAVKTSHKYAVPQITYNISVLDLSSLHEYKNYKPILGQKVPIFDIEMGLNGYEGIITSISKVLEKPEETNIEIATYQSRFEDIFEKLTSTMTNVKYNENELTNAANAITSFGTVKEQVFQKSLSTNNYQIQIGVNNEITIDKKSGITLVDEDQYSGVKIIGNGIFLTDNYIGNNSQWKTGITGQGINANALTAGSIDTKQITIWNASEGDSRFFWDSEGLVAYATKGIRGASSSTLQEFTDVSRYVKFNNEGLEFSDGGKSALSLKWNGLSMAAQNGDLKLDADNGLILKQNIENNPVTRLELGRLDGGFLYGLRLKDTEGNPSFQSDSKGDLWLSRLINVGGEFSGTTYIKSPDAGIIGIKEASVGYQMGVIRDSLGEVVYSTTSLRFWAGPLTKEEYLEFLSITTSEMNSGVSNDWDQIPEGSPSLSKFKVDANGNIIASGIDIGGWIGQGKFIKSKNNEAILRSGDYNITTTTLGYPVIAVGKPNENANKYGTEHNFRVYQDGTVNITKGSIHIGGFNVNENSGDITANLINGKIAGWTATSTALSIINNDNIGVVLSAASTDINAKVIMAGKIGDNNIDPSFYVRNNGYVYANNLVIKGGQVGGWTATPNGLRIVSNDGKYMLSLEADSASDEKVIMAGPATITEDSVSTAIFTDYNFYVRSNGYMYSKSGQIAGWDVNSNSLNKSKKIGTTTYNMGLQIPNSASTDIIFYAGINNKDDKSQSDFYVRADGYVKATNLDITNSNLAQDIQDIKDYTDNSLKETKEVWLATSTEIENIDTYVINPKINVQNSRVVYDTWSYKKPNYKDGYPFYYYAIQFIRNDNTITYSNISQESIDGIEDTLTNTIKDDLFNLSETIRKTLDGQSEVWYYNGYPYTTTEPTNSWSTSEIKENHIYDLYYDRNNGNAYQYVKENNNYIWKTVPDYQLSAAEIGLKTKSINDNKRMIFTEQPIPPYDIGDLWIDKDDNGGQIIKYCINNKNVFKRINQIFTATNTKLHAPGKSSGNNTIGLSIYSKVTPKNYYTFYKTKITGGRLTYGFTKNEPKENDNIESVTTLSSTINTASFIVPEEYNYFVAYILYLIDNESNRNIRENYYDYNFEEKYFNEDDWSLAATDDTLAKQNIKENMQLWFATSTSTKPPQRPSITTNIYNDRNKYEEWNKQIPSFSSEYPHYFYSWQYIHGDGNTTWGDVNYDSTYFSLEQKAADELSNFISNTYNTDLSNISEQIDNQIDVWYRNYNASITKDPTKSWTTNTLKDMHLGDLYFNTDNGYIWKYSITTTVKNNVTTTTYFWEELPENDDTITAIQTAQGTADGKRQIFVTTSCPLTPYDIGDMWINTTDDKNLVKYSYVSRTTEKDTKHSTDWIDTVGNKSIKKTTQLWYATSTTVNIPEPNVSGTTSVTSTTTFPEVWTTVVPEYNYKYPYYYYAWQYELADGTYDNSDPIFDRFKNDLADVVSDNIQDLQMQIDNETEIYFTPRLNVNKLENCYIGTQNDNKQIMSNSSNGYLTIYYKIDPTISYAFTREQLFAKNNRFRYGYTKEKPGLGVIVYNYKTSDSATTYVIPPINNAEYQYLVIYCLYYGNYINNYNDYNLYSLFDQASSWTTEEEKDKHLGDLVFNRENDKAWKYCKKEENNQRIYYWSLVTDSAIIKALINAENAQATADDKIKTFYTVGEDNHPNPPYDEGDIWVQEFTTTDSKNISFTTRNTWYSLVSKDSGSYASSDWILAGTDDTLAKQNIQSTDRVWYVTNEKKNNLSLTSGTSITTKEAYDKWTSIMPSYSTEKPYYYYADKFIRADNNIFYSPIELDKTVSGIYDELFSPLNDEIDDIQNQVDEKVQIYYKKVRATTTNVPASSWTTSELKMEHYGDYYYDTKNKKVYKYIITNQTASNPTYGWIECSSTKGITKAIKESYSTHPEYYTDGERTIFNNTPKQYSIGDLWIKRSNDILIATTNSVENTGHNPDDWIRAYRTIGGFEEEDNGLVKEEIGSYYTGFNMPTVSTDVVLYAGTMGKNEQGKPLNTNEFTVQADGYLKTTYGKIANFTITNNALYSDSKSTSTSNVNGVYIGPDAIALGKSNNFLVTNAGKITAKTGTIAGWNFSTTGFSTSSTVSKNIFYTGINKPSNSTDIVFYAGNNSDITKSKFYVKADGTIHATGLSMSSITNYTTAISTAIEYTNIVTNINTLTTNIKSVTTNIKSVTTNITSVSTKANDAYKMATSTSTQLVEVMKTFTTAVSTYSNLEATVNGLTITSIKDYNTWANTTLTNLITNSVSSNLQNFTTRVEEILTLNPQEVSIANIGGFENDIKEGEQGLYYTGTNYYTGMKIPQISTDVVFYAGTSGTTSDKIKNNRFYVQGNGYLKASYGNIGGWDFSNTQFYKWGAGDTSTSSYFNLYPSKVGTADSVLFLGKIPKSNGSPIPKNSIFSITGQGDVYFKGNIYGWAGEDGFKKGMDAANVFLYAVGEDRQKKFVEVEICQGLIIDIHKRDV